MLLYTQGKDTKGGYVEVRNLSQHPVTILGNGQDSNSATFEPSGKVVRVEEIYIKDDMDACMLGSCVISCVAGLDITGLPKEYEGIYYVVTKDVADSIAIHKPELLEFYNIIYPTGARERNGEVIGYRGFAWA